MEGSDSTVQGRGEEKRCEMMQHRWGKVMEEENGFRHCSRVKGKKREPRRTDAGCKCVCSMCIA